MRGVEGKYEYDPKTRQYRRKRLGETSEDSAKPVSEVASPEADTKAVPVKDGVPAEQNPAYAIRDDEDVNFKMPRNPALTPGKILFWFIFVLLFCGWMYFMYTMYLEDQETAPPDLESLIKDDEEFQEMMRNEAPIKPADVDVTLDELPGFPPATEPVIPDVPAD